MSLVRLSNIPYKYNGFFIMSQPIESVWSIIKDPMALYNFFLSNHDRKNTQLKPSFPLLYDLYEINNFCYGKNFTLIINFKYLIETDYFCQCQFLLKEKDDRRSSLSVRIHFVDYSKCFITFLYLNYMCGGAYLHTDRSIKSMFSSLNKIKPVLFNYSQTEGKIININYLIF